MPCLPLLATLLLFLRVSSSTPPTLHDCLRQHGQSLSLTPSVLDSLSSTAARDYVLYLLAGSPQSYLLRQKSDEELMVLCGVHLPAGALSKDLYTFKYNLKHLGQEDLQKESRTGTRSCVYNQAGGTSGGELLRLRVKRLLERNEWYNPRNQSWHALDGSAPCVGGKETADEGRNGATRESQESQDVGPVRFATATRAAITSTPYTQAIEESQRTLDVSRCAPVYPRYSGGLATNVGVLDVTTKECDTLCALHRARAPWYNALGAEVRALRCNVAMTTNISAVPVRKTLDYGTLSKVGVAGECRASPSGTSGTTLTTTVLYTFDMDDHVETPGKEALLKCRRYCLRAPGNTFSGCMVSWGAPTGGGTTRQLQCSLVTNELLEGTF